LYAASIQAGNQNNLKENFPKTPIKKLKENRKEGMSKNNAFVYCGCCGSKQKSGAAQG
jgi:hypothetical protein